MNHVEIGALRRARGRFKAGDHVVYDRGWTGVVTGEPSDSHICWCRFDGVGQFGADPRRLSRARTQEPSL